MADHLKILRVEDPVSDLQSSRAYVVLKGGKQVSHFVESSDSNSSSQISFTVNPPTTDTIVDRNVLFRSEVEITFTCTNGGAADMLQKGFDALRAFPFASIVETTIVQINNSTISANIGNIAQPLLRYNTGFDVRQRDYSTTPSMLDQSQRYSVQSGSARNPLAGYSDNSYEIPRGAFPMTVISNTATTATIRAVITEPMLLSPFVFGHNDRAGFIGIRQLTFQFNLGDKTRIWSHSTASPNITNFAVTSVTFINPEMLMKYITPRNLDLIPKISVYPLFNVTEYSILRGSALAASAVDTMVSQSIQLSSVPRRMYIFARKAKTLRTFEDSDTFFGIENIDITFNNQSGLLATATQQELYKMSIKNRLSLSWEQFSGGPTIELGVTPNSFGTVGSVVCVEFASDIALGQDIAPGMAGKFQLLVRTRIKNVNVVDAIVPELWVIIIDEGIMTIEGRMTTQNIGILTASDVRRAETAPKIDYFSIEDAYGGNFLSGLKDISRGVLASAKRLGSQSLAGAERLGKLGLKGAERFGEFATDPRTIKAATKAAEVAAIVAKFAPLLLPLIGLGHDEELLKQARANQRKMKSRKSGKKRGGVLVGGQLLSRSQLSRLLD